MAEKTSAEVVIGGKVYTLSGYESEEYLQKVAVYINGKLNEFDSIEGYQRFPADMKATLLELNIADDYFKAKKQADMLEGDLELKEKEVYDLKHELIVSDSKAETATKELDEALEKIKNLEKEIVKLQTELEK